MIHLGQTDDMYIVEVKGYDSHSQILPMLILALIIGHIENQFLIAAGSITTAVTVLDAGRMHLYKSSKMIPFNI